MKRARTTFLRSGLIALLVGSSGFLAAQCTNNNVLTGSAVTPPCPGTTTVPCVQGGQYALVNVIAGNQYTFSTCGASFDTQITIYNNAAAPWLGYNDDACGLQSTLVWTATFTGQLRVLVDQYNCANNTTCAPLQITCAAPPPPLTNDNPCGATSLTVNTNCVFQTFTNAGAGATTGVPAPSCSFYSGGDVWFSFTAPATGIVDIETAAGVVTDGGMAVYSAASCSGPFTEVACDDDSGTGLMPLLNLTGLTPGATYYIRFWEYGNDNNGTFQICLHGITSIPSGDCVYQLQMFDSFGDGWDGSTVGISVNGSPFTNYTVTGSSGLALIGVNIGDILVVQYTAAGIFQGEISYTLGILGGGCGFNSGSPPATGIVLTQTIDCLPPPAPPEDCEGGVTICNGQSFSNNASGTGCSLDLTSSNYGCLASAERQGTWYYFSPSSAGNVAFTISPSNAADDYDFAVWGPMANPTCPPATAPVRCSYSGLGGDTGLNYTATDNTEGAAGDKWVNDLPVLANQVFILYVSNWSQSGLSFDLDWDLSNGASLDCTVLPIELIDLRALAGDGEVEVQWRTASELNSSHFVVERSQDGSNFAPIGSVAASGTTQGLTEYGHVDRAPHTGPNYYRLRQVDLDGSTTYSYVVQASCHAGGNVLGEPFPNPTSGNVAIPVTWSEGGTVEVVLLDAMGRWLSSEQLPIPNGLAVAEFPLGDRPAGTYLVEVRFPDGRSERTRFLKH